MELYQLKYFKAAVNAGSIVKAARQLNMAPSSISKAISKLEDELNLSLVNHNGNRIEISSNGTAVLPLIDTILDDELALKIKCQRLRMPDNRFTIALSAYSRYLFEPLFMHEIEENMIEFLTLRENEIVDAISSGEAGASISAQKLSVEGFLNVKLFSESICVLVPDGHPLSYRTSVSADDLKNLKIILFEPIAHISEMIIKKIRDINPNASIQVFGSLDTFMQMFATKRFITFTSLHHDPINFSSYGTVKIPFDSECSKETDCEYYMCIKKKSDEALNLYKKCLTNIRYSNY